MEDKNFNNMLDDLASYDVSGERDKVEKAGLKRTFILKGGLSHAFTYYDGFKGLIDNIKEEINGKVLVIGSSIGTIPFYFKQYLNVDTIGVEFMSYRHENALSLVDKYNVKGVEFINSDIVDYDYPNDLSFVWIDNFVFNSRLNEKLYEDMFNLGVNFICYKEPKNIPINYTVKNIVASETYGRKIDHFILTKKL